MSELVTASNLPDPDRAYAAIIEAHRGLSEEESREMNARLVLILANHVGSDRVLAEALALARSGLGEAAADVPRMHPVGGAR